MTTDSSEPADHPAALAWRIPTGGDPRVVKLGLAQIGLASVVAALVLLVVVPREWLGPGLAGLVPLAVLMAYRLWRRHQQSVVGPDNVWIDAAGVHWIGVGGGEGKFARDEVAGFRVGREQDTVRPVPALTLYLAGGFESQPLELHPPATVESVRRYFGAAWQLPERTAKAEENYHRAVDVYSECHEENREWHFEGARSALVELFAILREGADELPIAPVGARPRQWIILAQRRQVTRLRLQRTAQPFLEHDVIGGPAEFLREIAERAEGAMQKLDAAGDAKFEVRLQRREAWTFHLHVREA